MSAQRKLNLGNSPQELALPGSMFGAQQIVLTFGVNPVGGTASVEVMPVGGNAWQPLAKATNLPLSGAPYFIRSSGWISKVRVTFTGADGGSNAWIWAEQVELPSGLFEGLAAITVQPYTEANVKNGLQFYARANWPLADTIAAAETVKLHFRTGTKPVIVKLRDFSYVAEELTIRLYFGPTGVAGGTPLTIHNYNAVSGAPTTCLATKNVTTTTDGSELDGGDPETVFGSANAPQRSAAAIPVGRERILPPLTSFIVAITNTGSGAARAQYFLDWYEGGSDLPL